MQTFDPVFMPVLYFLLLAELQKSEQRNLSGEGLDKRSMILRPDLIPFDFRVNPQERQEMVQLRLPGPDSSQMGRAWSGFPSRVATPCLTHSNNNTNALYPNIPRFNIKKGIGQSSNHPSAPNPLQESTYQGKTFGMNSTETKRRSTDLQSIQIGGNYAGNSQQMITKEPKEPTKELSWAAQAQELEQQTTNKETKK